MRLHNAMKNLLYILGGLLWMSGASVGAQESPSQLTLEQALDLALQQNQEIQIQQKRLEIADNNVYPGKAGLLPQINFIADASYANNLSDARIRTFQESPAPAQINIDESGVETRTLSALVQADYVFFAGFSGRYRYKLLQNEQGLARYQQEVLVNNTALTVAEVFLEISKLQGRETLLKESIKLTQNRLDKLKDRFQFGKTTGLEILRGESDLNQDRNTLDQILLLKNNLLKDLNFLLGLEPEKSYEVQINYVQPEPGTSEEIRKSIRQENPSLKLSQAGLDLASNQLNLNRSQRYPQLSGFANYGFFRQENDVQQLAKIQNLGFTMGLSLRYNIFNGKQARKEIQNAQINRESNRLRRDQTEDDLYNQAIKELSNLKLLQTQLGREQENLKTFEENFARSEERYLAGKITSLEVRDAQLALLNAQTTINDLAVDLLRSSLRLENLKGTLLRRK